MGRNKLPEQREIEQRPSYCEGCFHWLEGEGICESFVRHFAGCWAKQTEITLYIKELEAIRDKSQEANRALHAETVVKLSRLYVKAGIILTSDILEVYKEDKHRGHGGGSSESDSNSEASIKAKMKDNRPLECKQTKEEKKFVTEATKAWEEEYGSLEKLSKNPLSTAKIDSYTGDPIPPAPKKPRKKKV